jgi:hypothetical protein
MISADLRKRIVDLLLGVPLIESVGGRTALLASMPSPLLRDNNNTLVDLQLLLSQLEVSFEIMGDWRLIIFIKNATNAVEGTELAKKLRRLLIELENVLAESRKKKVNPSEIAQPYLFDLKQPVMHCLAHLSDPKMCGFVLPAATSHPLRPFCDRLKHNAVQTDQWKRDQVFTAGIPLKIDPLHTSVDLAFRRACELKVKVKSQNKIVIWPVYIQDSADALELWSRLKDEFGAEISRSFIAVFGMPPGISLPDGLLLLPAPNFKIKDVKDWISPIVESLEWRETLADRWTRIIVAECRPLNCVNQDDDLLIDRMYEQLEYHRELLTQHQTEAAFIERLDLEYGN